MIMKGLILVIIQNVIILALSINVAPTPEKVSENAPVPIKLDFEENQKEPILKESVKDSKNVKFLHHLNKFISLHANMHPIIIGR